MVNCVSVKGSLVIIGVLIVFFDTYIYKSSKIHNSIYLLYIWEKQIKMESIRVEIINPKAKRLLKNLADIGLIKITEEETKSGLSEILDKLRSKSENAPSLEEITKEVESVRKDRHEKSQSNSWYKLMG